MIMVARKRVQRVNIFSKIKTSTTQRIPIFKKREKRPKVNIFKGIVIKSKIGFTAKFITPKANPARIKDSKGPVKLTSGIPVASQIPRIPTKMWHIKSDINRI